eukprot:2697839-Pleurochrysis_carterae.AAC.5
MSSDSRSSCGPECRPSAFESMVSAQHQRHALSNVLMADAETQLAEHFVDLAAKPVSQVR